MTHVGKKLTLHASGVFGGNLRVFSGDFGGPQALLNGNLLFDVSGNGLFLMA